MGVTVGLTRVFPPLPISAGTRRKHKAQDKLYLLEGQRHLRHVRRSVLKENAQRIIYAHRILLLYYPDLFFRHQRINLLLCGLDLSLVELLVSGDGGAGTQIPTD